MTNDLGRIELHDPQSREYEFPRKTPTFNRSVHHTMSAPNVDQFFTSGCVGFSGTNMLNCAMAVRSRQKFNSLYHSGNTRRYLGNQDGLTNYSGATKNDPFDWTFPPTDEGSSAIGLMKFWMQLGVIKGYDWTFNFNGFLAALQRQPVLVGTNWYPESMNRPQPNGLVSVSGRAKGGHEYLAAQILWDRKWIGFQNSWGENWGLKGMFYMHFADVQRLLINEDGDSCAPRFL